MSAARAVSRIKPPFNMNTLALKAGEAALKDKEFLRKTLETNWEGLDFLYGQLERLGLHFVPSQTNFVLVDVTGLVIYFSTALLLLRGTLL